MSNFYHCITESILTNSITVWYSNCSSSDHKALQSVVRTAELIPGHKLLALQDIYQAHFLRKACSIIKDCTHPAHDRFASMQSSRCPCSIRSRTTRLKKSFIFKTSDCLTANSPSSSFSTTDIFLFLKSVKSKPYPTDQCR